MRRSACAAAALAVACTPPPIQTAPRDPGWAIDDAYVPFGEPLRSALVGGAAAVAQQLKPQHKCAEMRLLRVPAEQLRVVADHYRRELRGWRPHAVAAPALSQASGWEKDGAVFAIMIPQGTERGFAGYAIVTDAAWDAASRKRLAACRG